MQGSTAEECLENVQKTCELMECLGFSQLIGISLLWCQKQTASFLGNIVNTVDMIKSLPEDKKESLKGKRLRLLVVIEAIMMGKLY